VSRSGSESGENVSIPTPEGVDKGFFHVLSDKGQELRDESFTVYVKVNYRVLLLIAVIFDVMHLSINEMVARLLRNLVK